MRALLLLAVVAAPAPVHGVALPPSTGLRLLVSDQRPFVLDVDSGKSTRLAHLPAGSGAPVTVLGVGGRAAVVNVDDSLYAVRGTKVSRLGVGAAVVPDSGGRAVWIKSVGERCSLRQVGLGGRTLRTARPFPCASTIYPGLVVNRTRLIDPRTGATLLRTRAGIIAVTRGVVVSLTGDGRLLVLDRATRAERELQWPGFQAGLADLAVDPRGRYVALAGGNPAWNGTQLEDLWLLDTESGELTQLPGMPATVELKRTSIAWTDDGRLVLLGVSDGRDVVAVWRPGEAELAVKTVRLPVRDGGSDSFAPLG